MVNSILEINDAEILMTNCKCSLFSKKVHKTEEKPVSVDFVKKFLRSRVILILEDEEIYIKYLTLPKVEEDTLERMITEELKYYYKLEKDICFSYTILKKNEYNVDIILFYINSKKLDDINLKCIRSVKGVYLLQFCFIEYLKKFLNVVKTYILCTIYNKNLYFVLSYKGILKANFIEKNFFENQIAFEERLTSFIKTNKNFDDLMKIYTLGIKSETLSKADLKYEHEDLGEINKYDIFSLLI